MKLTSRYDIENIIYDYTNELNLKFREEDYLNNIKTKQIIPTLN